ncbi:MAG TPA: DEAD/DEAH box helicase, partial [Patescibacteria group bacterium]|nr:DEAD/DEAH box helicase [Patescibacteria group bacterium]
MPLNDIFITDLHGVGPKVAERLKVLGIRTVKDLIYYLPREHEDLSVITSIIDIVPNKKITVRGTIERIRSSKTRWKRMNITEACIHDTTHQLRVTWFNQPYITESLKVGDEVLLSGTVKHTKQGLNLQSPEYEKVQAHTVPTHIGRIVPKYPLTAGVTQKQLRYFVKQSLKRVLPITDHLPQSLITRYHLLPLSTALQYIHFPESVQQFQEAKKRLNFDELFIVQLAAQLVRNDMQKLRAPILQFHEKEIKSFVQNLPFQLTTAQRKTSWSILQDIQKPHPMNRLLIGDVGSGKTVVAAMAMLNAVLNGFQAVLMAPTEILATQHAQYLTQLFKKQSIRVAVHTAHRKTAHHSINTPAQLLDADIIIGTHALIQEGITFQ